MYFLLIDGQQYGPYPADEVRQWQAQNRDTGEVMVWMEGWNEWRKIAEMEEFTAGVPVAPTVEPAATGKESTDPNAAVSSQPVAPKGKMVFKKPSHASAQEPSENTTASAAEPTAIKEQTCPNCKTPMAKEAVLCMKCGYNRATRQVVPGLGTGTAPKVEPSMTQPPSVTEDQSPSHRTASQPEDVPLPGIGISRSRLEQATMFMLASSFVGFFICACSDGFTSRCGWFYGFVSGLSQLGVGLLLLFLFFCAYRLLKRCAPGFTSSHPLLLGRFFIGAASILSVTVTITALDLTRYPLKLNALGLDSSESEVAIAWFSAKGLRVAPDLLRIAVYNGVRIQKRNSEDIVSIGSYQVGLRGHSATNAMEQISRQFRRQLWDSEPNPAVARGAFEALKRIGPEAIPLIGERLKTPLWLEAIIGIDCLKPEPRVIVPLVLETIQSTSDSADSNAFITNIKRDVLYEVLIRTGPPAAKDAVPMLVTDLGKGDEAFRAMRVLEGFGLVGKEAVPAVIPYARNPNRDLRSQAIKLLGIIGRDDGKVLLILTDVLTDEDPGCAQAAAAAVEKCVVTLGKATIPHLLKILTKYPEGKTIATDGNSAPASSPPVNVRKIVFALLARLQPTSKDTVLALEPALQSNDLPMELEALKVLEHFGGEEAQRVLLAYIFRYKEDPLRNDLVANAKKVWERLTGTQLKI